MLALISGLQDLYLNLKMEIRPPAAEIAAFTSFFSSALKIAQFLSVEKRRETVICFADESFWTLFDLTED